MSALVDQIVEKSEIVEAAIEDPQHAGLRHGQNLVLKVGIMCQGFSQVPDLNWQTGRQIDHRADFARQSPPGSVSQCLQLAKQRFQRRTVRYVDVLKAAQRPRHRVGQRPLSGSPACLQTRQQIEKYALEQFRRKLQQAFAHRRLRDLDRWHPQHPFPVQALGELTDRRDLPP